MPLSSLTGLGMLLRYSPTVETVGYFLSPARGWKLVAFLFKLILTFLWRRQSKFLSIKLPAIAIRLKEVLKLDF